LRGRQQHLLDEYVKAHAHITGEVLTLVDTAYRKYIRKNLPLIGQDPLPSPKEFIAAVEKTYGKVLQGEALEPGAKAGDKEAKIKMHINTVKNATTVIDDNYNPSLHPQAFYAAVQDILYPLLDEQEGSKIRGDDHAIFTKLTKRFEDSFFKDVRELNVEDPDELTRVTEYGPEIATFVDKIVDNKFGYSTSDGSVYFDIDAFEKAGNSYARLEPWNRSNNELQADGEGALSQRTTEKRSPADFAIWKASKPGEPSWPSTWGPGRPGWHIECSAMASAKLGKQMDIHSGGIDLAFPHHDNELAQSEAYWSDAKAEQWVNYFLHMGHLSIAGSKMSKSLKNFTTIRTALERGDWTPRSLRIVFLLGGWRDGIEITDDLVQAGGGWEDRVDNFFLNVKDAAAGKADSGKNDTALTTALRSAESEMYEALCDSFSTAKAMAIISRLVGDFNSAERGSLSAESARAAGKWVTKMVNIFGLNGTAPPESDQIGWSGIDIPSPAKPYVLPLASMRDNLREAARSKEGFSKDSINKVLQNGNVETGSTDSSSELYAKVLENFKSDAVAISSSSSNLSKDILSLCDRVRDIDLWNLNIYLEDRDSQPALVRPVTAALAAAKQEREERTKQKEIERAKREREAKGKAEKCKLSHKDMFRTEEFSAWDEDGLPTKMANGDEVAKSKSKKLRKDWERQKKAHEAWLGTSTKA
jgi:cysteinyl-tRNA synthetase